MKKIHPLNCIFILSYFVDKTRQECHDETITEMGTETILEQQCTGKVISTSGIWKRYPLNQHFYFIIISADKTRQECHDETITEMVTETIMEQQCTGKLIHISIIRKISIKSHFLKS